MHMIGSLRPAFSPRREVFLPARHGVPFQPLPYSMGRVRLGQAATPAQLAQLGNFNSLPLSEMLGVLKSTSVTALTSELGIDKALGKSVV